MAPKQKCSSFLQPWAAVFKVSYSAYSQVYFGRLLEFIHMLWWLKKNVCFFPPNLIHRCSTLIHPLPELSVLVPVSVRPFSQKCSICHDWSALTGLSRAPPTLALNVCKVSECECFAVDTTFTVFIQHLDLLYDQIRHSPILQYDTFKIAVVKFRVTAERCDFIIALHLHLQRFWYKT